jgi:hypothetical protein
MSNRKGFYHVLASLLNEFLHSEAPTSTRHCCENNPVPQSLHRSTPVPTQSPDQRKSPAARAAGHRELPHLPQPRPEHHGQRALPSGTRPRAPAPSSSIMHSEADAFDRLIISSAQQDFYSQATSSCRWVKINTGAMLFHVFAVDVLHLSTRKCSMRTVLARISVSIRIEFCQLLAII